jgi:hypothetical protein
MQAFFQAFFHPQLVESMGMADLYLSELLFLTVLPLSPFPHLQSMPAGGQGTISKYILVHFLGITAVIPLNSHLNSVFIKRVN